MGTMSIYFFPRVGAVFLFTVVFLVSNLVSSAGRISSQNSHKNPTDITKGKRIFRNQCSTCHGADAQGLFAPDLTRGNFRHAESDSDLFRIVSDGISGTSMYPLRMSDRQIWQVVSFVRTLEDPSRRSSPQGNIENGKILFQGRGECTKCHMVNGEGGRLGPDLSDIGWKRSVTYLEASVRRPSDVIGSLLSDRYASTKIETLNGVIIEGVLLNEDGYSLQIMDEEETLFSYLKRDLQKIEKREVSAMPSYEETFSDREFEDLVSYLYFLRKK